MLSWYRSQMREHGLMAATSLLARVAWPLARARAANKLLPARYQCPCCGWRGRRFYDYCETGYRVPNTACPQCDSHARHRLFYLWLKNEYGLARKRGAGLIFAPERALAAIWETAPGLRLYRMDLLATRGVDVLADAQKLPFCDESFDFLWCHHVLEQVPDDRAAMRELRRVLRSNGELIISAGLQPRDETEEFGFSDKRYSGNQRGYGRDFPQRLREAGWRVEAIAPWLSEAEAQLYGVRADEPFFICRRD